MFVCWKINVCTQPKLGDNYQKEQNTFTPAAPYSTGGTVHWKEPFYLFVSETYT